MLNLSPTEAGTRAQDCPTTAGEPPHLTVTIDWDALRTGLGIATRRLRDAHQRRAGPPVGL